jgi:hypothetical protein
MKYEWTVKHYHRNPRQNETVDCDTKADAIAELQKCTTDSDTGENSILYCNGERVAYREWHKKNIDWLTPQRGGHRSGAGRKPTGKAMAMFYIRVPADLKEQLSKVDPEKIRMELSKIVAPQK